MDILGCGSLFIHFKWQGCPILSVSEEYRPRTSLNTHIMLMWPNVLAQHLPNKWLSAEILQLARLYSIDVAKLFSSSDLVWQFCVTQHSKMQSFGWLLCYCWCSHFKMYHFKNKISVRWIKKCFRGLYNKCKWQFLFFDCNYLYFIQYL